MKKSVVLVIVFLLTATTFYAEESIKATPYGFVKLDAIYETGRASHGNFSLWAADPGESDGLFHLTGNETRLGLKISGIRFGDFKVKGQVEVDFYGGGAENKALNFMRHAFILVSNGRFSLKAGQTWDIICPLNPTTLNYTVLWAAGNIGYRRPQLSVRQDFTSEKSVISLQGGVFRTITQDYDSDGINDGIASATPTVQGRLSARFMFGESSLQLGVSAHYGTSSGAVEYSTSSINGDLLFVLSPKIKLLAEYYNGRNMGAFLGGIVQEVNNGEEIRSTGFWANLVASLCDKMQLSVGYGLDDPNDEDLSAGMRAKNSTFFGNLIYKLSPHLLVGLELSNWTTEYLNQDDQKTFRIQHSWKLVF